MKFSQFAGSSIVPLLSRIVLALAFVTTGYNKLIRDKVFNAQQAETLKSLGVSVTEVTAGPAAAAGGWTGSPVIVLARFQDTPEQGVEESDPETDTDAGAGDVEAPPEEPETAAPVVPPTGGGAEADGDEPAAETPPAAGDDAAGAPLPPGEYTARGVHSITLLCHMNNWPMPTLMAYVAGITELLGGALVLVGFMTRIWALGLAFTMGVAFYFVSMGFNNVTGVNPFDFAQEIPKFNTAMSQLGLFALSFGLVLTGAGPLSLDRLLFGGGGRKKKKGGMEIEYEDVDNSPSRAI